MTSPSRKNVPQDLTGMVFGRLTAAELSHCNPRGVSYWRCKCECGSITIANKYSLFNGRVQSCGCIHREQSRQRKLKHGMSAQDAHGWVNRTYRIWVAMRTRCNNPNTLAYPNYGGRGIKVCPEWDDFSVFLRDMGECPPGLSIERRDNNGRYEKSNCYWADALTQRLNQRKRTHCPQGHPYVPGNIDYRGRQFCRPCRSAHNHRCLARRKQRDMEAANAQ